MSSNFIVRGSIAFELRVKAETETEAEEIANALEIKASQRHIEQNNADFNDQDIDIDEIESDDE